jgi:hypothetical protein
MSDKIFCLLFTFVILGDVVLVALSIFEGLTL